jgi:outer membrane protein TolC
VTIPVYTLADCQRIARDRQPALQAARASLAAKQAGSAGLDSPKLIGFLVPDLNLRRQQAHVGVSAAAAEVMLTEHETDYAIARTYYTAIYANQQLAIAKDVADNLAFYLDRVKDLIEKGGADLELNRNVVDRLTIYLKLAQSRQREAEAGVTRAVAALREAMGVGHDCDSFQLADLALPVPTANPDKCTIIQLALSRRGELTEAESAELATRLEIDAQGKYRLRPQVNTFAMGGDVHARSVPQGMRNGEYRPGAIGIEMPPRLTGNRSVRMEQAGAYNERAAAVVRKTSDLIRLEAEDAFALWEEYRDRTKAAKEGAAAGRELQDRVNKAVKTGLVNKPEDVIQANVLTGQAQGEYQSSLYQQILALAALERITAGGFCAGLGLSAPATLPAPIPAPAAH